MFDFFRKKEGITTPDVKSLRHALVHFIKEQLQKVEGGEGRRIQSIQLYLNPGAEEKHLYEAAVYKEEAGRFGREQVQKIADDYGIALPQGWNFELHFSEPIAGAVTAAALPAAVVFKTQPFRSAEQSPAIITIREGIAEQPSYTIKPGTAIVNIGREKMTQTAEGFSRTNAIAFVGSAEGNQYISRQHAHIEWDEDKSCFILFADEGGVPPRNKVKIKTASGEVIKLLSTTNGHVLQEGDEIMLGASALLSFSIQSKNAY